MRHPCSHALRGNTCLGRSASERAPRLGLGHNDAERRGRRSHAERGNEINLPGKLSFPW
jgi:hypothetical protein